MRIKIFGALCALTVASFPFVSCDDDVSNVGSSLTKGELNITVDSTEYNLNAESIYYSQFDGRSTTNLIGKISTEDYGSLDCGFVSRLMSAVSLSMPDSIGIERIDSLQIIMSVKRNEISGDSLIPQQVQVYRLLKPLPDNIDNDFDPTGYYDPSSLLGKTTFTLSTIGATDSVITNKSDIRFRINLPRQWGVQIAEAYRSGNPVFQWPSTFADKFAGIYVRQSFGNGCIANINKLMFQLYWHRLVSVNKVEDGVSVTEVVHKRDSTAVFATAPEVLAGNIIRYTPSSSLSNLISGGQSVITTPGGYICRIHFPAEKLLERYNASDFNMTSVSNLSFTLPASPVKNNTGIGVAPYLLMVKTSEMADFFAQNKLPDEKTSFWAKYDSSKGSYHFGKMRNYIIDILKKGEVTANDTEFTLVPVYLNIEESVNSYTGVTTTYVVGCTPYLMKPTMTRLETNRAMICFTFSSQKIN